MATYQTKKCPMCGTVYERNSYAGRPSKDNRTKYGSPLKQCKKCGHIFIDKEYREIAIDGVRKVDTKRISPQTLVYTGFSLLMSVFLFKESIVGGSIFLAIGAFLSLEELLTYKKRQIALQKERQESENRLKNKQYAQILKQCGYYVPEIYLNK